MLTRHHKKAKRSLYIRGQPHSVGYRARRSSYDVNTLDLETFSPQGLIIPLFSKNDLGTGKPNEQKFKLTTSITGDGSEALVISPVSTQISRAYSKSGVTLSEAQEKVGKAYGLDEAFDNLTNFDPIALAYSSTSNEQAKAALTAQARNIMVSSLGEVSKKVSEYFASEIAPTNDDGVPDTLLVTLLLYDHDESVYL